MGNDEIQRLFAGFAKMIIKFYMFLDVKFMETCNKYILDKIFVKSLNLYSLLKVCKRFRDIVKSTSIYQVFTKATCEKTAMGYIEWSLKSMENYDYDFVKYILKTDRKWPFVGTVYDGCMVVLMMYIQHCKPVDKYDKLVRHCVKYGAKDLCILCRKAIPPFDCKNLKFEWVDEIKEKQKNTSVLKVTKSANLIKYLLEKVAYDISLLSSKLIELPQLSDDVECYSALIRCNAERSYEFYCNTVKYGRLEAYKQFVHSKLPMEECLTLAARNGQLAIIKYLTLGGQNLDRYGRVLLENATAAPTINVLEYLLEKVTMDLNELFLVACRNSQIAIVEYLIQKGADICYLNNTPILLALETNGYDLVDVVKFLIRKGANVGNHANPKIKCGVYDYAMLWATMKYHDYLPSLKN